MFKVKCPGTEFSFSGLQNKVQQFFDKTQDPKETAAYALRCISYGVLAASKNALKAYPGLPVVLSGGVASNAMLRSVMDEVDAIYAEPRFSTDNAMGVAILAQRLTEG